MFGQRAEEAVQNKQTHQKLDCLQPFVPPPESPGDKVSGGGEKVGFLIPFPYPFPTPEMDGSERVLEEEGRGEERLTLVPFWGGRKIWFGFATKGKALLRGKRHLSAHKGPLHPTMAQREIDQCLLSLLLMGRD